MIEKYIFDGFNEKVKTNRVSSDNKEEIQDKLENEKTEEKLNYKVFEEALKLSKSSSSITMNEPNNNEMLESKIISLKSKISKLQKLSPLFFKDSPPLFEFSCSSVSWETVIERNITISTPSLCKFEGFYFIFIFILYFYFIFIFILYFLI